MLFHSNKKVLIGVVHLPPLPGAPRWRGKLSDAIKHAVADAKAYLSGREPFRRETARQWAEILAEAEFYGLPFDDPAWREAELQRPDRAAIEQVARRHLKPGELKVAVGLPKGS